MALPVHPPIAPMLARRADSLPEGEGWLFEPKWDGFRALVFREGGRVHIQSRDLKDLVRYFPELHEGALASLPSDLVLDGEVVVAREGALDFDALLQRIHPAASRVRTLAAASPASFVAFDLLALGDRDLRAHPLEERRARLEEALADAPPPLHLTPATRDRAQALDWFERFEGAGFDGVVAKALTGAYQPGKRVMMKVKHQRTADCVIGGLRWAGGLPGEKVASLLLGLYDRERRLHHVGVVASFNDALRRRLANELAPLALPEGAAHPWRDPEPEVRAPGGPSRWSRGRPRSFVALRPERVIEVSYDHTQGDRFRHTTQLVRFRPDKPASECTYDQLEVAPPAELGRIFGG